MYMYKQCVKVIIKTVNMIFKCSLQSLYMPMKSTHVMIVQIIQEQSLDYNPL